MQLHALNAQGVSKMEVKFAGSGAITDLIFDRDGQGQTGGELSYALDDNAPAGMTINSTGLIDWIPTEAQGPGTYEVNVLVSDGTTTVTETFQITVAEVNVAPTIVPISDQVIDELDPFELQVEVTDVDLPANTLTFRLAQGAPEGISISNSGLIQWTPSEAQGEGVYAMTVVVSDGNEEATEEFSIIVGEVNLAPVIQSIDHQEIDETTLFELQVQAADSDLPMNALAYSLADGSPEGMTINGNGLISWTPSEQQGPNLYPITVLVRDGIATTSESFELTVNEVNSAPVLSEVGSQTTNEEVPFEFQLSATDVDLPANDLAYSLVGTPPAGMSVDTDGLLTWTPNENQGPQDYSVTVEVSDGQLTDSKTFTISVNEVNVAPVISPIADQQHPELADFRYQVEASDADLPASALAYELISVVPAGMTIDADGLISWTPTEAQGPASYEVNVQVSDGVLTDVETFQISVTEQNLLPVLSAIDNQTVFPGNRVTVQATATDADLPANTLTFSIAGDVPVGATIDSANGLFSWDVPADADLGGHVVTITVDDQNGGVDSKTFSITVEGPALTTITLTEADRFKTTATQAITVPAEDAYFEFDILNLSFDTDATNKISDAFEVALLDVDGNSLVHTIAAGRDAFFNTSEPNDEAAATNTVVDGSVVRVDLSHLPAGTAASVVYRLINNDNGEGNDTATTVTVTEGAVVAGNLSTPVGSSSAQRSLAAPGTVDFETLTDVTSRLTLSYRQTSFNDDTDTLFADLVLTNNSSQPIDGPFVLVVQNLTNPLVAVTNADGTTRNGDRYYLADHQSNTGTIQPGETTLARTLSFLNSDESPFDYNLTVLAAPNKAPVFTSTPVTLVEAGRPYSYDADGVDPNVGDTLTYELLAGPDGMAIDSSTGEITWSPETGDMGNHSVVIKASDGRGAFDEQQFTVEVRDDVPNRPPIFVTDPATEAIASSGFEVTTVGVGDTPAGVAVIDGIRGPRIVTANADDQTIGIYAGQNNDRFDDATSVSTGFPTADGQLFDVGYAIDVAFPEQLTNSDTNAVEGVDQGDLNGDGIVDFVVMTSYDSPSSGERYQFVISALIGTGDGTFSSPLEIYRHSAGTNQFDPRNLVLRDFNNDGALDVLATERQQDPRLISILGNGDGTFAAATEQRFAGRPLSDFHVADVDEDGTLDLIGRNVQGSFNFEAVWAKGVGDGTFEEPIVIGPARFTFTSNQARAHDVLDLNGDGNLDFVFMTGLNVTIYHSDGAGNFTLASEFSPSSDAGGWLRGGDFNGDGFQDLVYQDIFNSDFILLLGDGSGIDFTLQRAIDLDRGTIANYAGSDDPVDIDNDGDLDLIFGHSDSQFTSTKVAVNDGSGNFTLTEYAMVDFSSSSSQRRFDTGDIARGAMFGDYNSDGVIDYSYFTSGGDSNGVGVRLGTRPGEFGRTKTIPWTQATRFQEATPADFNGDGIIDLIDTVNDRIALGNGDGSFGELFPATGVARPSGYGAVADFNLDGFNDIVAARANTNGSRYYAALGNGDGTFTVSDEQLVEASFYGYDSFIVADFNADGYPDFAAKTWFERQIDVHLNDPNDPGVFTRTYRITLPSGTNANDVLFEVADFTGDGIPDLSFAERDVAGDSVNKLVVMAGDGAGDFTRYSEFEGFDSYPNAVGAPFYSPGDFAGGDLDSDGDVDLVAATNYGARIFLNDGAGSFSFLTHLQSPGDIQRGLDSWLVDFNGDGHLDFVQVGEDGFGPLIVRLGNGDASFREAETVGLIGGVSGFVSHEPFADLDGDGQLDFVYGTGGVGNYIDYTASIFAGRRDDLVDLVSVDLDGDGNEEVLAIQDQMERLQIFQGDTLGGLTRLPDLQTGRSPKAIATGDLNGDGGQELFVVNRASRTVDIFVGDLESGYLRSEVAVGLGPIDVALRDIDGDEDSDVVVLDDAAESLWILRGDGSTTLAAPVAISLGDRPSRFVLEDADGDGSVDAVITLSDSNRLMIVPDVSGPITQTPIYVSLDSTPSDIAVLDVNADGNPDLVSSQIDDDVVGVLYGLGGGQFARVQNVAVGKQPTRITTSDVDEDGRLDLIVANEGDDTVSVIYNRFDPNEVYRYDADAVDPDDDPVTYSIVEGPGGLIINGNNGKLLWAASPDQVGVHDVTIAADDGRGGVATQSFKIEVEPARENSTPLIATVPDAKIGAGETFQYQSTAIDGNNDALRYRLLSAPDDATIDPVTGLVQWDGRSDGVGFLSPDGAAVNSGDIITPVGEDSSLALNTLTVEGWFNPQNLTATNGAATLFRFGGTTEPFHVRFLFNRELELFLDQEGTSSQLISRVPLDVEVGRWYHIALSLDDDNQRYNLLVDGQSVLSGDMQGSFVYDDRMNLEIGGAFWDFSGQVDNFRVWNTARTAEQIREGMLRQYDDNPNLVLDYRFEVEGARIVRDNTAYRNDGYLTTNVGTPEIVPGGLAEVGTHTFVIGVEDGRGGFDEQSFDLEILPELRGSISGIVFDDLDGDSVQDDGTENPIEPGLNNLLLFIDSNNNGFADPAEPQSVTNINGEYRFDRLLPGTYPLSISPKAGFETPTLDDVSVSASAETSLDIANSQLALGQVRGALATEGESPISYWSVYADLDGNQQFDEGEPSVLTDRDGNYAMGGLAADDYNIRVDLPAGWADTVGQDGLDVTLAVDEVLTGNDFTLAPSNTSVTGGLRFVTSPVSSVEARQTFRYASIAKGILDEPVVYDLSLAPEGMVVDPTSGLVAWRPTTDQVGPHTIILRATSQSGSIALHDFAIDVTAPNTAPVLSVVPDADAFVGLTYAVDLQAQDAEGQPITFTLLDGPTGATLDATSGALRWLPAAGDVGTATFEIELAGDAGAANTVSITTQVTNDAPAATPFIVNLPRTQIGLGQDYFAQVSGVDALDRPLSWTLNSGPDDFVVSTTGNLTWTPGNADLGDHAIQLQATGVDGDVESIDYTLTVVGRAVNFAPIIESEPTRSAVIDQTYQYDIQATDADSDPLAYVLLEGSVGMSVHPALGTLLWTPANDQRGDHDVMLQVTDPDGETATQQFTVRVSRFGGPPRITSVAATEAAVGQGYLYTVTANDAEGDPLTYRLLTAPAGMTIVETTGEISWTPDIGQIGDQDVVIQVSDGVGGASTEAFRIRVAAGARNLPPEVGTTAPRFGAVGSDYSYLFQANDPESTTITYSLGQSPAGMTIDSNSGLVSWTPVAGDEGQVVVTLIATDADGGTAIESFQLDILAANTAPVIFSNAPTEAVAGESFQYQVLASDNNLDPLAFTLTQGALGATIDTFGRVQWSPGINDLGDHDFSITVSDPRGGVATQSFTLTVVADTQAPLVSLIETPDNDSRNVLPWQGPFTVYTRAIDNVAVASLTLTANGQDIPLSADGTAVFTFEDWSFQSINATATAVDVNGNTKSQSIRFEYDFPEGWSGAGTQDIPTAAITTPTESQSVTGLVSIVGTADHPDLFGYKLLYRRVDQTDYVEFANETTAVINGELGVWDTSLLLNDEYIIRLEVATNAGVVNVVEHNVGLAGELKLGNFQLSFTDMVIPVAGIPIEITRIYDTLQADREGDFGFGWRLEYRDTDLRVGLPESGLEDIGIYSPLRPGVKVYLNVPGEGRQGFTFNPEIRVLPGFGGNNLVLARPRFVPDPGVSSTLSTGISGYLTVNERGELFAPGSIPYNPASPNFGGAYMVTTKTGVTYRIDGDSGNLLTATDVNNNRLSFTEEGIQSDLGRSISFTRDAQGRIVSIENDNEESYQYQYNTSGSLQRVIDPSGNESQYEYDPLRPNYLANVIDPLGNTGIRAEYDEDGRIISVTDPTGNSLDIATFIGASSQELTDALGNQTQVQFDELGNVASETDALGNQTLRTHDTSGNVTSVTDPLGRSTVFTYDGFRNILTQTTPDGGVTRFDYINPIRGLIGSITNPQGQTTRFEYDSRGNLLRTITPDGSTQSSQYDAAGRLTRETLTSGGARTYQYDAQGNLIVSVDENGLRQTFRYDDVGQLLESSRDRLVDGVVTTIYESFEYDLRGNLIRSIDAAGGVTSQTYDANDRLITSTDPLGRVIKFVYDANGNVTETVLPDDTPGDDTDNPRSQTQYDALDRVIAATTPDGSTTRFEYDAVGRMIATIFDDETPTDLSDNPRASMAYDAAGQLIVSTDANGNETEFTYGTTGNLVRAENTLGDAATFQHDASDRVIVETDEAGVPKKYTYDNAGRLIETTDANGNVQSIDYDALGRPATRSDELGRSTVYQYDSAGRIIAAVDPAGNVNTFDYDAEGNLIVQRDASGRETTYRYDELGRRIRTTRPDGTFDQSIYDAVGNLVRYTDFNGDVQAFVYDSQNRRISRTIPGTGTTALTYTEDGLVASETDERGTTTYEYDSRRRLTGIVSPDGNEIRYQLDDNGNVLKMTTLIGETSYVYDELDRIQSVTDALGNTTTYTYDPLGRLLQTNESNGLTETRSYNSIGHLQRIQLTDASDNVLSELTYETDAAGRRTAKTDAAGNRETYAYDEAGRLITQEQFAAGQSVPESSTRFAYDATGNRVTETDSLGNVTTYVYDVNDRLLSTSGPDGVVSYTYDANGNRTSKTSDGVTTRYVFSSDNRLNRVDMEDDGVMDVAYDYDARGNLVERQENGDVTRYQLDLRRSLAEAVVDYQVDGTPIAGYTHAVGLVSQQRGGESFTYHTDGLGSVIAISDENAAIVNEYRYDSFGETEQATETVQNEFLFDGQRRDPTTGLDYLRARFYDSETGRFVGVDPFEGTPIQTNSIHDYTYAGNDPINSSDPSGRFTLLEVSFASSTLSKVGQAFSSSAQTGLKRAARIADNLIAPGTQMQNIGLQLAFGTQLISDQVAFEDRSISDRGYDLYLIGSEYRQAGFQALRVTITGIYADTLKSLGAGAVKDIAKLSPSLKRVVTGFENVIKGIEQFNKLEKFTYVKIPTGFKPGIDQLIDGYIEATDKSLSRAELYGYLAGTQTNFEKGVDNAKKIGDLLSKALDRLIK